MQREEKQNNKIAALYPMTKFYMALAIAVITLLLPGIELKAICFVCLCILAAASGVIKTFAARMMKSIGVIVLILLMIQTLFYPAGTPIFSFWIFTAKARGFSVETPSTHYYDIHPEPVDKTVQALTGIVLIVAAAGRILLWLI